MEQDRPPEQEPLMTFYREVYDFVNSHPDKYSGNYPTGPFRGGEDWLELIPEEQTPIADEEDPQIQYDEFSIVVLDEAPAATFPGKDRATMVIGFRQDTADPEDEGHSFLYFFRQSRKIEVSVINHNYEDDVDRMPQIDQQHQNWMMRIVRRWMEANPPG